MKKQAAFVSTILLTLGCVVALALIAAWTAGGHVSLEYRRSMESLYLDTATKMQGIKIAFWGGVTLLTLAGLGGLIGGLLRVVWRRSRLIQPHETGLFPVVENRVAGQIYYHDPNRQWAGTSIYGAGPEGTAVRQVVVPGQEEVQFKIASQAQAAQLVAAANQGKGLTAPNRRLVERVIGADAPRPAPRLPHIVILDESLPQDRRLMAALQQDWPRLEEGG